MRLHEHYRSGLDDGRCELMKQLRLSIPFPRPTVGDDGVPRTNLTQAEFVLDVQTPTLGLAAGMGFGKTYAAAVKAVLLSSLNPGTFHRPQRGMVSEPTAGMIEDILMPEFEALLAEWAIPHVFRRTLKGWNIVFPRWNHVVLLRSADKPNGMKGPTLAWYIMDEAGQCKQKSWAAGASRVRDAQARVRQRCAIGTPEGLNWFYERFGTGRFAQTRLLVGSTRENIQNLGGEYWEELKHSYDPTTFLSYGYGRFVTLTEGSVFGDLFRRETHVVKGAKPIPGRPLEWGMDFNVTPMCACAWQVQAGVEVCVAELTKDNTHTEEFAEEMQARWPLSVYPDQVIYCDPSGKSRHTSSAGRTDISILRNMGYRVEWRHVRNERDPINEFRRLLKATDGRIRAKVSDECVKVITALEMWAYRPNSSETKEREYADSREFKHVPHMADACKYFAHTKHPIFRPTIKSRELGRPLVTQRR
jgi:hypothetical protein